MFCRWIVKREYWRASSSNSAFTATRTVEKAVLTQHVKTAGAGYRTKIFQASRQQISRRRSQSCRLPHVIHRIADSCRPRRAQSKKRTRSVSCKHCNPSRNLWDEIRTESLYVSTSCCFRMGWKARVLWSKVSSAGLLMSGTRSTSSSQPVSIQPLRDSSRGPPRSSAAAGVG